MLAVIDTFIYESPYEPYAIVNPVSDKASEGRSHRDHSPVDRVKPRHQIQTAQQLLSLPVVKPGHVQPAQQRPSR